MKTGRKYGEKEKMQILIKSLIFRTLQIYIFSFYAFLFFVSLASIEILHNVIEHFIIGLLWTVIATPNNQQDEYGE